MPWILDPLPAPLATLLAAPERYDGRFLVPEVFLIGARALLATPLSFSMAPFEDPQSVDDWLAERALQTLWVSERRQWVPIAIFDLDDNDDDGEDDDDHDPSIATGLAS